MIILYYDIRQQQYKQTFFSFFDFFEPPVFDDFIEEPLDAEGENFIEEALDIAIAHACHSAPGPDGIPYEAYKGSELALDILQEAGQALFEKRGVSSRGL